MPRKPRRKQRLRGYKQNCSRPKNVKRISKKTKMEEILEIEMENLGNQVETTSVTSTETKRWKENFRH